MTLLIAAVFSLLGGGALLFVHRFPARMPPLPADPHAKPLDFADRELRHALRDYATYTLARGLPAIDECRSGQETYRVVRYPGLGSGRDIAVNVAVSGSAAIVETWTLAAQPKPDGYAWQFVSQRTVDEDTLEAVRSESARLLLSDLPAAVQDGYVDASEYVLETCRNERYHFYRRHNFRPGTPFDRLARNLLALSR